jgi:Fe-S-cluster-containing hydrogenase component 2
MSTKTNASSDTEQASENTWEILVVDPRRCVGCEICESVCSFAHDGIFNPVNSRINRVRIEPVINTVINCLKCFEKSGKPECVTSCELNALSQDLKTGLIILDEKSCDGCASCVKACPYGAITIHSTANKAIMCDLCVDTEYDTPQCVDYCPKGAIFVEKIVPDEDEDRLDTLKRILKRGFQGSSKDMLN